MRSIEIDGRRVGHDQPPYMVAEISANHGGSIDRAHRILELAAKAGAHAVKFQLYTADDLTLDVDRPDFYIRSNGLWQGERLYDLYSRAATPADWFPSLYAHARALGVTPFASVFSPAGIEPLERLDSAVYKIASFEAVDLRLVEACARTGKPVIVSTGICDIIDVRVLVDAFRRAGGDKLILLKCNSAYPADPAEANLLTIPDMTARFGVPVGYSDHTLDAVQAVAAVALGACLVEKHVIDAREPATPDSAFSSLPEQFAELAAGCRAAFAARGRVAYGPTEGEQRSLVFRRSLYAVRPIRAGEAFTHENVRAIRPGYGLHPRHLANVIDRRARRDLAPGEPLAWDDVG